MIMYSSRVDMTNDEEIDQLSIEIARLRDELNNKTELLKSKQEVQIFKA